MRVMKAMRAMTFPNWAMPRVPFLDPLERIWSK